MEHQLVTEVVSSTQHVAKDACRRREDESVTVVCKIDKHVSSTANGGINNSHLFFAAPVSAQVGTQADSYFSTPATAFASHVAAAESLVDADVSLPMRRSTHW